MRPIRAIQGPQDNIKARWGTQKKVSQGSASVTKAYISLTKKKGIVFPRIHSTACHWSEVESVYMVLCRLSTHPVFLWGNALEGS